MAAGALLFDAADRILLVQPTYKRSWEIPGGVVEADESPHTAVCRELKEELGLHRVRASSCLPSTLGASARRET
jgi:ADP-ribose pyrophosphatase YjhB (NUDIX family)